MKKILILMVLILSVSLVSCSEDNRYVRVMKNYSIDEIIASVEINIDFEYALLLSMFYNVDYTADSDNLVVDVVFGYNETDHTYAIMYVPEKLKYTPIIEEFNYLLFDEVIEVVDQYNFTKNYGEIHLLESFNTTIQFPIESPYQLGLYAGSNFQSMEAPFSLLVGYIQNGSYTYDVHLVKNTDNNYTLLAFIDYVDEHVPTKLFEFH